MRIWRRQFVQFAAIAVAVIFVVLPGKAAWSQTPRTIKIVVPVAPGGVTDMLARLLGEHIRHTQGQCRHPHSGE
jgi:tripartite-type tricarboxylate transporter receptor subunit TctC